MAIRKGQRIIDGCGGIAFTKLHGLGNDYLYIDARVMAPRDWPEVARRMSDRHFGVGADGIILIERGRSTAHRMRIFNADGSEAEMCGNGLRGFAKWLYDRGEAGAEQAVETGAGVLSPRITGVENGRAVMIRVDLGAPRLDLGAVGFAGPAGMSADALAITLDGGETVAARAVSMGNPHLLIFGPLWEEATLHRLGPALERHPWFPQRINVHSVEVVESGKIRVRHWERGSGPTLACGTGVAAALVAAAAAGGTGRKAVVEVPGGSLEAEWGPDDHVYLEGPAVEVFRGYYRPL